MTRVRPATPRVAFIDQYCAQYRDLFHNVRHFDQFTALHLGLLAETRRKSLPRLGKTVHVDPQAFQHFLAHADWSVEALRRPRLEVLRQAVGTTPFILCLDETGDRKKGHTTDYAASQYIGNVHTLANGIVSVNADGLLDTTTLPLLFRLFKPQSRLKPGDDYKTQPHLAIEMIEELLALGLRFSVVLADSLSGASGPFIAALHRRHLQYVVALRSTHGVWMLPGQRIRQTRWRIRCARLHRRQHRPTLSPRDHLRHPQTHPLFPAHHRSRTAAAGEHLGSHDQSSWQDRGTRRQYVWVTDLDRIRV
jgi:SRSO17 transposase